MTPQPLPLDLLDIFSAWRAGIASHQAGFALTSNPYRGFPEFGERLRDSQMKSWAFALGWREAEWLMERRQARGAA